MKELMSMHWSVWLLIARRFSLISSIIGRLDEVIQSVFNTTDLRSHLYNFLMFWSNHKYHRTGFYIGINYVALGKGNKWLLCKMNGFNSFRNRNMLFVGSVFLCSRWLVLNGNWFVHLSTDTHFYSNTWRARAGFIQWITSWLRLFLQVSVLTWFSKTLKVLNIWIRI